MTVYQEMEDESSWLTLEQMGFPLRSEFANENQGEAGNNAMTTVLIKPQFFWQRSFCTVAYAHMHERICIFLRRVCMHLDRCFGHHACAGVYVKRVPWTSAYTFANTLATGCAYALMHVQFVRSALRERGWMGSSSQLKHLLLGLGGYFWEKER